MVFQWSLQGLGKAFFTNVSFGLSSTVLRNCKEGSLYDIKNRLLEYGYKLEAIDDEPSKEIYGNYLISYNVPLEFFTHIKAQKKIAVLWEPPTVWGANYDPGILAHYDIVFTWFDDLVDNKKFFKFYGDQSNLIMTKVVPFEEKKLCVLINNNKNSTHEKELYSARRKAIKFFEKYHPDDFILYGGGWHASNHPCYRGPIGNKIDYQKNFKFCICYENMCDIKGYITEKIFDAFKAGCVPVYWGASNVTDYIPADCFIDRRQFKNYEELYAFLTAMSPQTYENYIKNIQKFLGSPRAYLFSADYFLTIFFQAIEPLPSATMPFLSPAGTYLKYLGVVQARYKQQLTHKMTYLTHQQKKGSNKWH